AAFLAGLARAFESRDHDARYYPVAVFGVILGLTAVVALLTPDFFRLLVNNLLRIVGFSANAATRTIAEARPFLDPQRLSRYQVDRVGMILIEYGMAFFTAAVAAIWLLVGPLLDDGDTREYGYVGAALVVLGVALVTIKPDLLGTVAAVGAGP
ncbi:dolichyl-diphosphooligosaccharide--protein glycosyltransferase, partial [Halobium palmae]